MGKSKDQKGVAVVEFALVLPILVLLVFGIIEFSLMLYDKAVITNASREGARFGIVMNNPSMTEAQISAVVTTYCSTYLIGFPASTPIISFPSGVCPDPPRAIPYGTDKLNVTVNYDYSFLALQRILNLFRGSIGGPTTTLSATTVMNCE